MIKELLTITLATFAALLPIVNPFSATVVFLSVTSDFSETKKRRQALMACVYTVAILIVFLVAGTAIMKFFGISLPGVRIAGGLIVAGIGFAMIRPEPQERVSDETQHEAELKNDVAFSPLAMPMMSGPGSIAVTLGLASNYERGLQYGAIAGGILLIGVLSWIVLRSSEKVVGYLGVTGMNALTRIMGFLLVSVGVQFIVVGAAGFLTDEELIRPFVEMILRLSDG